MTYKAIRAFRDLQDKEGHIYLIGDVFPYVGYEGTVPPERFQELLGHNNKVKYPVIAAVEEVIEKATRQVADGIIEKAIPKKTTRKKAVKKEVVEGE